MSEEALSAHIDDRIANGDSASLPTDPEARALAGTVQLVAATLSVPAPSADAEAASRERLLTQMRESLLEPRELHEGETSVSETSWLGRVLSRFSRLFKS